MSKEKSEEYKKQIEQMRSAAEEELMAKEKRQYMQMTLEPSPKNHKLKTKEDIMDFYEDWLRKYQLQLPDFEKDKNKITCDENGTIYVSFNDTQAAEDFTRNLAKSGFQATAYFKEDCIGKLEGGKLIDPRTNQEFPDKAYAELLEKLKAGVPYKDIPVPESKSPTPFSLTPR